MDFGDEDFEEHFDAEFSEKRDCFDEEGLQLLRREESYSPIKESKKKVLMTVYTENIPRYIYAHVKKLSTERSRNSREDKSDGEILNSHFTEEILIWLLDVRVSEKCSSFSLLLRSIISKDV